MKNINSAIRSIVCAAILLGVLFLVVFSFIPGVCADHDCAGERCLVCLCGSFRENLSDVLIFAAWICVVFTSVVSLGRRISEEIDISIAEQTPVYLKVKLSN